MPELGHRTPAPGVFHLTRQEAWDRYALLLEVPGRETRVRFAYGVLPRSVPPVSFLVFRGICFPVFCPELYARCERVTSVDGER